MTTQEILMGEVTPMEERAGIPRLRPKKAYLEMDSGFPQGSPLSPILSIYAKQTTSLSQHNHVMYADDGLLFNLSPSTNLEDLNDEGKGVYLNREKTH